MREVGRSQLVHDLQLRDVGERVPRDPVLLNADIHHRETLLQGRKEDKNDFVWTVNTKIRRTVVKEGYQPRLSCKLHLHHPAGLYILHGILESLKLHLIMILCKHEGRSRRNTDSRY